MRVRYLFMLYLYPYLLLNPPVMGISAFCFVVASNTPVCDKNPMLDLPDINAHHSDEPPRTMKSVNRIAPRAGK